ncbi:hypothetical protein HYU93_04165 [Candidatus Daviesbacteria bacterium]|nr:hypothetical protein [Candidatus Daviesbacteria bacterium]
MFKIIQKIVPGLLFWGVVIFVIFSTPYPDSLTQANLNQTALFFIPLYLAFVFTLNIILKNIFISSSISLGLIFFLILQALDSLNIVTGILIIISVGLLVSYFKKNQRKELIKLPKIHKLTNLRRREK